MAMFNELVSTIKILTDRIDNLENGKKVSRTTTVVSKDTKKTVDTIVGNLIFNDKTVRTGSNYMNSKTRFAIGKSIEELGGVKLERNNEVVKKYAKKDKYVQVYEFKTVADCKKFMEAQQKRVG